VFSSHFSPAAAPQVGQGTERIAFVIKLAFMAPIVPLKAELILFNFEQVGSVTLVTLCFLETAPLPKFLLTGSGHRAPAILVIFSHAFSLPAHAIIPSSPSLQPFDPLVQATISDDETYREHEHTVNIRRTARSRTSMPLRYMVLFSP
jgi:hypothetical protein